MLLMPKQLLNETAESSDIVYAMQPYASVADSLVTVSDSEIEKLVQSTQINVYKQKEKQIDQIYCR
jgi:peptidyl-prolyl cis-trans isomerase D